MNVFLSCVILCFQNESFPAETYSCASNTFSLEGAVFQVWKSKSTISLNILLEKKKQIEITSYHLCRS